MNDIFRLKAFRRRAGLLIGIAACLSLSACAQPEGPKETIKQAIETAPADLQLACVTQAEVQFNTKRNRILPIRSSLLKADVFDIELTSKSRNFHCEIDRTGKILSLAPSTAS